MLAHKNVSIRKMNIFDKVVMWSGQDDGKVSLWSRTGDLIFTWWPHEAPVTCVALRWGDILFEVEE
jgi:hypothetical protein